MKYLKQFEHEISQEEFEEVLGRIPLIDPVAELQAYVDAVEMTPYESSVSCIIYLDQAPPDWLIVTRQWPDGIDTHRDWKHEMMHVWNGTEYVHEERWFMSVEIAGGKYDPGAGQIGPFTFWLASLPGNTILSQRVAGIGWKAGTAHQHTNIYFRLGGEPEPPDPEPPDPEPPDPEPPCGCKCEEAKQHIVIAQAHLDEAVCLLDGCACSCGEVT